MVKIALMMVKLFILSNDEIISGKTKAKIYMVCFCLIHHLIKITAATVDINNNCLSVCPNVSKDRDRQCFQFSIRN